MGKYNPTSLSNAVQSSIGPGGVKRIYHNMNPKEQAFFKFLLFVKYNRSTNFVYLSSSTSVYVPCKRTLFSLQDFYTELSDICRLPNASCICNNL